MWNNEYKMIYIQDYKMNNYATPMATDGFYHMWDTSPVLAPHYDMSYNKITRSVYSNPIPQTISIKMISTNVNRVKVNDYVNKIKSICFDREGKPEKVKMYIASNNVKDEEFWYSEVFLNGDIKIDYDLNKVIVTFNFIQYDTSEYFDYYKLSSSRQIVKDRINKPYYENKNLVNYYNGAENAQLNYSLQINSYDTDTIFSPLLIMRCISEPSIFYNLTIHWVRNKEFIRAYNIGEWMVDMKVPSIEYMKSVHHNNAAVVIGVGIDFSSGMISLYNLKDLTNVYNKMNKILEDKTMLNLNPLSIKDLKPQEWEFGNNGMWITPNLKWNLKQNDYITFQHKGKKSNLQYGFEAYAIYRTRRF